MGGDFVRIGSLLAAAVIGKAFVVDRQKFGMLGGDLVVHGECVGDYRDAALFRRPVAKQPRDLSQVRMQAQFPGRGIAACVFLLAGFGQVLDMAQNIAQGALGQGDAEMGADAPIYLGHVVGPVSIRRQAAQQHQAAPEHQLPQDLPQRAIQVRMGKIFRPDIFQREAPCIDLGQTLFQGGDVGRAQMHRDRLDIFEIRGRPGLGIGEGFDFFNGGLRHGVLPVRQ